LGGSQLDQLTGDIQRLGKRLLDQDMESRAERRPGDRGVPRKCCGHQDRLWVGYLDCVL
jgi:hypothetical protein